MVSLPAGGLFFQPSAALPSTNGAVPFASIDDDDDDLNPKPKRPLSSYNYFFQDQRRLILIQMPIRPEGKPRRSHGKIGFAALARLIAARWKGIDQATKKPYEKLASLDKARYKQEMAEWKLKEKLLQNHKRESHPTLHISSNGPVVAATEYPPLEATTPRMPSLDQGINFGNNSNGLNARLPYSLDDILRMISADEIHYTSQEHGNVESRADLRSLTAPKSLFRA